MITEYRLVRPPVHVRKDTLRFLISQKGSDGLRLENTDLGRLIGRHTHLTQWFMQAMSPLSLRTIVGLELRGIVIDQIIICHIYTGMRSAD